MRIRTANMTRLLLSVVLLGALTLTGCATGGAPSGDSAPRSQELTPGQFPSAAPPAAQAPPPPMLKSPQQSVYSYLLWISYAYRILNSDVATMAFSPYEEVRVNSYVELNRQEGRAIDQRLVSFDVKSEQSKGSTATVVGRETWRYRYIDIKTRKYKGPAYDATYDTTYTVVKYPDKGWLVDKVQATAVGAQPK